MAKIFSATTFNADQAVDSLKHFIARDCMPLILVLCDPKSESEYYLTEIKNAHHKRVQDGSLTMDLQVAFIADADFKSKMNACRRHEKALAVLIPAEASDQTVESLLGMSVAIAAIVDARSTEDGPGAAV